MLVHSFNADRARTPNVPPMGQGTVIALRHNVGHGHFSRGRAVQPP